MVKTGYLRLSYILIREKQLLKVRMCSTHMREYIDKAVQFFPPEATFAEKDVASLIPGEERSETRLPVPSRTGILQACAVCILHLLGGFAERRDEVENTLFHQYRCEEKAHYLQLHDQLFQTLFSNEFLPSFRDRNIFEKLKYDIRLFSSSGE
eukprot:IDg8604t1